MAIQITKSVPINVNGNTFYTKKSETVDYYYYTLRYKKLPNYIENENNLKYNNDSACFDICAAIKEPILLFPNRRVIVDTGVAFDLDSPLWLRVNDRSGLACNSGITTLAGIIDSDYRGEVKICLYNTNSPLRRYITVKSSEVYVTDNEVIENINNKEARHHINETYLNVCGSVLTVYTKDIKVDIPNGNIFRFNKGSVLSFPYAHIIKPGDRIAQMELPFPYRAVFKEVEELSNTNRGESGFGSTGI